MSELLGLLLFSAVVAAGIATALKHWRPNWSLRRTLAVAATPLPGILAIFCVWLFLDAAFSSKQECGVDACGMAMMFATLGLAYAASAFLVGAIVAVVVKRIGRV